MARFSGEEEVRDVADSCGQRKPQHKALRERLPGHWNLVNKRESERGWVWNGSQGLDYTGLCGPQEDFGL